MLIKKIFNEKQKLEIWVEEFIINDTVLKKFLKFFDFKFVPFKLSLFIEIMNILFILLHYD